MMGQVNVIRIGRQQTWNAAEQIPDDAKRPKRSLAQVGQLVRKQHGAIDGEAGAEKTEAAQPPGIDVPYPKETEIAERDRGEKVAPIKQRLRFEQVRDDALGFIK